MKRATLAAILVVLPAATPCIWDSDTLGDELRGLPDALRLVTGCWMRHGAEYYAARIAKLPAHLEEHGDDLAAYDDLAVAYERQGDRDAALAVMDDKRAVLEKLPADDARAVEHRYREHANRGTFLAHSGRFDEALVELGKALEINPAAHFGRERWQIEAIRYVAACKRDASLWAKHDFLTFANVLPEPIAVPVTGRASYTVQRLEEPRRVAWNELHTAVVGMLRFGGLEGAELWRTLGDLHLAAFQRFERAAIGAGEDVTSEAALKRLLARADAEIEELLPAGAKATTR